MQIVTLTVTLFEAQPEVKRVIEVPDNIRLDQLHECIQYAMGWWNYHMYSFEWRGKEFGERTALSTVIKESGGEPILYLYDFGDNWEHIIEIGEYSKPVGRTLYPQLVEVTNRCPPEDCGGVYGYEDMLKSLADPKDSEHEATLEWLGGPFDPLKPDTEKLKKDVKKFAQSIQKNPKKKKPRKSTGMWVRVGE